MLLKSGADINLGNEDGATPFFVACYKGNANIVKILIEKGADVNESHYKFSALYMACANGHNRVVRILLDRGADLNVEYSPLDVACDKGHDSTVKLLLQHVHEADVSSYLIIM